VSKNRQLPPQLQKPSAVAPLQAKFQQGLALHQAGRLLEAELLYKNVLRLAPKHFDSQYLLGVLALQSGRTQSGVEQIAKAIKINPKVAEAHLNLGNGLRSLSRLDDALASYNKAIALRSDFAEAHNARAIVLRDREQFDDALASFNKAVDVKPDYVEVYNNRGIVLRDLKRLDDALASFDKAIALKPGYADAHYNRGIVLRDLKRLDDALASYEQAIALNPDHGEAYINRGLVLQSLKRFEDALASFDQAVALRPDSAQAHNNRGIALKKLNRSNEALASYDRAIALNPNYAEAFYNRAIELMELGRLDEAQQAADKAIQLAPKEALYYRTFGSAGRYSGDDKRLAVLEELAQTAEELSSDDRIDLCFVLAKAYEDVGRFGEAFDQLKTGNALKRRQIIYDEAAELGAFTRIQELYTPQLIQSPGDAGESSSVPIFIVGMVRSGSTLVEQILASHPQVFGGGELDSFAEFVARSTAMQNGEQLWAELASGLWTEQLRQIGVRYVARLRELSPQAERIVNKLPSNFMHAGLIQLALPNATIIHTVRDPRDTCVSAYSKLFTEEQNHTYDLAELGRYYASYHALMAHWHRVLPAGRILDVQYEAVVADLEGQARRLIAHCGLDWDSRCLTFHQTDRPVRTASAIQVRQPIYDSSIGRWRVYEPFLGPLLAELGLLRPY
jgi:tetratricopeptide (TPR) repeat protein